MSDNWVSLLPLLLLVVVFWLLIVRPARKRQQQYNALQAELGPGENVITTSGIYAQIVSLDDTSVVLRIAEGVEITMVRQAIGQVVSAEVKPEE